MNVKVAKLTNCLLGLVFIRTRRRKLVNTFVVEKENNNET